MVPARDAVSHLIAFSRSAPRRLRLIRDALAAYENGALYRALQLLDICCQLPVPSAEDLLFRAEVLTRIGAWRLAAQDVKAAYAIDPTQPVVLARHLSNLTACDARNDAVKIAWANARLSSDLKLNPDSIRFLAESRNAIGFGLLHAGTGSVRLVVLTKDAQALTLELSMGSRRLSLSCRLSRTHQLSPVLGLAGIIEVPWEGEAETVTVHDQGGILWRETSAYRPFYGRAAQVRDPGLRLRQRGSVPLTVIVPVYSGLAETRRCITSLLEQDAKRLFRVVLVDDCGPDEALRAFVQALDGRRGVTVLTNPFNLGFIGSVNRALQAFPEGDVLLLNADAVLPPGAIDRLAAVAYSDTNIGTVTPLSNNGELTSSPIPFAASPLPDDATLALLDRSAQSANPGKIVDLPNGIGFCLYIRGSCRRTVGLLNDRDFVDGYLEEVDFCLRASEAGFRNVCACDIYVGHAGGTSFEDRRRDLVMRNLAVLQRYFPEVKTSTHHFVTSDPLKEVRHRHQLDFLKHVGTVPGTFRLRVTSRPLRERLIDTACDRDRGETDITLQVDRKKPHRVILYATGLPAPYALPLALDAVAPLPEICGVLSAFTISEAVFEDGDLPIWTAELPKAFHIPYRIELNSLDFGPKDEADERAAWLRGAHLVTTLSEDVAAVVTGMGARVECREWEPLERSSQPDVAPPADATASIAVLAADQQDPSDWLVELARAGLSLKQPLRFVVFGQVKDPEPLRRTGCVSVLERPDIDLAQDMFQLHSCVASIVSFGPHLRDDGFLTLASLAPRPCFVDRDDAAKLFARCGEAVTAELDDPVRLHHLLSVRLLRVANTLHD